MNKPEIVKNLKKLLDQVGFTQVWAAKKLEISPVYLNRVINGDKVPSDDLTMRMMELSATLESCGLVSVV